MIASILLGLAGVQAVEEVGDRLANSIESNVAQLLQRQFHQALISLQLSHQQLKVVYDQTILAPTLREDLVEAACAPVVWQPSVMRHGFNWLYDGATSLACDRISRPGEADRYEFYSQDGSNYTNTTVVFWDMSKDLVRGEELRRYPHFITRDSPGFDDLMFLREEERWHITPPFVVPRLGWNSPDTYVCARITVFTNRTYGGQHWEADALPSGERFQYLVNTCFTTGTMDTDMKKSDITENGFAFTASYGASVPVLVASTTDIAPTRITADGTPELTLVESVQSHPLGEIAQVFSTDHLDRTYLRVPYIVGDTAPDLHPPVNFKHSYEGKTWHVTVRDVSPLDSDVISTQAFAVMSHYFVFVALPGDDLGGDIRTRVTTITAVSGCLFGAVMFVIAVYLIHQTVERMDVFKISTEGSSFIAYEDLKIGDKIGRGSFATVYSGTYLGSQVAVKQLINSQLSKDETKTFVSEISLLASLRHPNIVLFMAAVVEPLCLVTELMNQGSLAGILACPALTFSIGMQLNWCLQSAQGMQYLHRMNVVHRDLKSFNILVSGWVCKISDFGLSYVRTDVLPEYHLGTLLWSAPEILSQELPFSPKSDIYSYAIVVWEIFSRATPFQGVHPLAVLNLVPRGHRPRMACAECLQSVGRADRSCSSCTYKDTLTLTPVRRLLDNCWDARVTNRWEWDKILGFLRAALLVNGKNAAITGGESTGDFFATVIVLPFNADSSVASVVREQTVKDLSKAVETHYGDTIEFGMDTFKILFSKAEDCCTFCYELMHQKPSARSTADEEDAQLVIAVVQGRLSVLYTSVGRTVEGDALVLAEEAATLARAEMEGRSTFLMSARAVRWLDATKFILEKTTIVAGEETFIRVMFEKPKVDTIPKPLGRARMLNPLGQKDAASAWFLPKSLVPEPLTRLGTGTFGEVYTCDRKAASPSGVGGSTIEVVKFLKQQKLRESTFAEFSHVICKLRRLEHTNIVPLEGVCLHAPKLCIISQRMSINLFDALQGGRPIQTMYTAQGIAAGVAYLHSKGVLHQGITPTNILFTPDNEPMLSDYGLDILRVTMGATTVYTNRNLWLSPEVMRGEPTGMPDDVFAVGIALLSLCTGNTDPMPSASTVEAHLRMQGGDMPSPPPNATAATAKAICGCLLGGDVRMEITSVVTALHEDDQLLVTS